jgi:hypothetical protein
LLRQCALDLHHSAPSPPPLASFHLPTDACAFPPSPPVSHFAAACTFPPAPPVSHFAAA